MEPNTLGRKLGIGMRVASKMLVDRAAQTGATPAADAVKPLRPSTPQSAVYAQRGKAAAAGAKKFGEAVWKPFAHASGVLWLEVTGLFFGIFALFFGVNTWKLRFQWQIGPDHRRFLTYTVVTLVFAYFTFSSFYRARRKQRARRHS